MRLSARILDNVSDVNTFTYTPSLQVTNGNGYRVYIQLIDLNQDKTEAGFQPYGKRYCADSSSTLQVTLDNLDTNKKIVRACTQPFVGDWSIWYFDILESDIVLGTIDLQLLLSNVTAGTYIKGRLQAAILSDPQRV